MAMQCLAHPEGEIGMAKAAAKNGIPMVETCLPGAWEISCGLLPVMLKPHLKLISDSLNTKHSP